MVKPSPGQRRSDGAFGLRQAETVSGEGCFFEAVPLASFALSWLPSTRAGNQGQAPIHSAGAVPSRMEHQSRGVFARCQKG